MSGTDFYYGPQAELARKLAQLAPGSGNKRVFVINLGIESVEAAFKLARYHTKRKHMIAFFGAFHGRTMGALSLTASKVTQRVRFAPLIPQVSHVDYPNCYRCPLQPDACCCFHRLDHIENKLFKRTIAPDEVAAIIVEPIQGEGGYIVPPPDAHHRLKALTQRHGILLIADEVQSGMGRTGKMFAMEHWEVEPDIICLAKGICLVMPLRDHRPRGDYGLASGFPRQHLWRESDLLRGGPRDDRAARRRIARKRSASGGVPVRQYIRAVHTVRIERRVV